MHDMHRRYDWSVTHGLQKSCMITGAHEIHRFPGNGHGAGVDRIKHCRHCPWFAEVRTISTEGLISYFIFDFQFVMDFDETPKSQYYLLDGSTI